MSPKPVSRAKKPSSATAALKLAGADKNLPLMDDIRLLGRILGEVIREQEGRDIYELIERIRKLGGEPIGETTRAVRRAVVDHEHAITVGVDGLRQRTDERLEGVDLVVGRDAHDGPRARRSGHRAILP